jgi:hypothetical protein
VSSAIWQLTPRKHGDLRGAVSALDAAYVLQTVSGMRSIDAQQALACDVTANGSLTALDATRILQFAVGQITQFAAAELCASDWLFVAQPLSLPFQQLVQPILGTCQSGAIEFLPLIGDASRQNFTAVVLGDCSGNWNADAGSGLGSPADGREARLGTARARPGGRWIVPLSVTGFDGIFALSAGVGSDPSSATFESVDVIGAGRDAIVVYRDDGDGLVQFAMASPEPIDTSKRPLAVLTFKGSEAPQAQLFEVTIDETPATILSTQDGSAAAGGPSRSKDVSMTD